MTGNWVASGAVHSVCTDTAKVRSFLGGGMWYCRIACQDIKRLVGINQQFFDGEYPCLVFCCHFLSCTGVRENNVAEAEVMLLCCSWWWSLHSLEQKYSSDWVAMILTSFWELQFPPCWIPATPTSPKS